MPGRRGDSGHSLDTLRAAPSILLSMLSIYYAGILISWYGMLCSYGNPEILRNLKSIFLGNYLFR